MQSNANEIKNKYLQLAQNNQAGTSAYINAQRNNTLNQMNSLLKSKYGENAQYNSGNTWHDYGNAIEGYNTSLDAENLARYNALQTQLDNYDIADQEYNAYRQGLSDQQAQNSLNLQKAQLYNDAALKAKGINGGLSETSRLGLSNNYINANNNAYGEFNSNVNDLYRSLADSNIESRNNLNQEINAYRNANSQIMANAIGSANSLDELKSYYDKYGNYMDEATKFEYQQKADELKKEELANTYGVDINQGLTAAQVLNRHNSTPGTDKTYLEALNIITNNVDAGNYKNGDVIEIKAGRNKKYLVLDGMLYETNRPANVKWKQVREQTDAYKDYVKALEEEKRKRKRKTKGLL